MELVLLSLNFGKKLINNSGDRFEKIIEIATIEKK